MDMEKLREEYEEYAKECSFALRLMKAQLENLQEQINAEEELYDPFESMKGRIKTFDSVVKKCEARGYELSIDSIKENVKDIAGIRIITPFVDNIYDIAEEISKQRDFNIASTKDYVAKPKSNGYQSLHLTALIMIYAGKSKLIPVEIQIRTGAMNLWAKREHLLQYKGSSQTPEMQDMFKEAADFLIEFDKKIMELRDGTTSKTESTPQLSTLKSPS